MTHDLSILPMPYCAVCGNKTIDAREIVNVDGERVTVEHRCHGATETVNIPIHILDSARRGRVKLAAGRAFNPAYANSTPEERERERRERYWKGFNKRTKFSDKKSG